MPNFTAGTSFTDGVTNDVTALKLNALVADAVPTSSLALTSTNGTIANFTASTANITLGTIPTLTSGTTTGTAGIFTSGTITTALIPTGTFGTTTSTAATITTGTIPTLTTGTTTSTNEVVTNGTITNLSATTSTFLGTITGSTNVVNIGSGQIYKDASGKVLIGTTSNDTGGRLEVKQGSSEIGIGIQSSGTDNSKLYFRTASGTYGGDILFNGSYLKVSAGTTEQMRIDSSGNVGIGTTSPSSNIGSTKVLEIGGTYGGIALSSTTPSSNKVEISNFGSNTMVFATNATEQMRIDSGGNVYVGTTNSRGKFTVEAGGGSESTTPITTNSTTGAGTRFAAAFYYSGTKVGSIDVTGSATAYVTSSDYRLKTNLEPIVNGINRIKQLPVYSFNWKIDESGNKVDGFVAHEAQAIVPESVTGEKDAVDSDGNPIYQGIDQSKIVPLLTAALKEAITKIEVLESKVAALEAA